MAIAVAGDRQCYICHGCGYPPLQHTPSSTNNRKTEAENTRKRKQQRRQEFINAHLATFALLTAHHSHAPALVVLAPSHTPIFVLLLFHCSCLLLSSDKISLLVPTLVFYRPHFDQSIYPRASVFPPLGVATKEKIKKKRIFLCFRSRWFFPLELSISSLNYFGSFFSFSY